MNIPKIIHFCWFGRNPLPSLAKKCIESWRKFFPDWTIIEWNEDNYDVNKIPYISEAYEQRKYAFVSDYARFDILYQYGGIYFDTDVEVIKSFDDILSNGMFMGFEIDGGNSNSIKESNNILQEKMINPGLGLGVAPGLGLGVAPGLGIIKKILDYYQNQHFVDLNGKINTETVVTKITRILIEEGLKNVSGIQKISGVIIYPKEYFNPLNNNTGKLEITDNTHSIHWYSMTWMSKMQRFRSMITRPIHRIFGETIFHKLRKINKI